MFTTKTPCMTQEEIDCLVDNNEKLDNMVSRVAEFLVTPLQLTDDRVAKGVPFVEVSRQRILHFPTREAQEDMKRLKKAYDFAVEAEDVMQEMRDVAQKSTGKNVNILPFTKKIPYYYDDVIMGNNGGVMRRFAVGGMGRELCMNIQQLAVGWLDDVDSVISGAAGIKQTHSCDGLQHLKRKLACSIAVRLSMMCKESVLHDPLSARQLGSLIEEEYKRCYQYARNSSSKDANAMCMLRVLAGDPRGAEARYVLQTRLGSLRELVHNLPVEMRSMSAHLKLEKLSRALVADIHLDTRVELATMWSDEHGALMVAGIDNAIETVKSWAPTVPTAFKSLIKDTGRLALDLEFPRIPFLHCARCFARRSVVDTRTGLDEQGERSVRIVCCLMEMAGRGFFMPGIVSAESITPVATYLCTSSRMAARMIEMDRDFQKIGWNLLDFISHIADSQGEHREEMDKAVCSLSMFSCNELETVFTSHGTVLRMVCNKLGRRTWERLRTSTKALLLSDRKDDNTELTYERCEYKSFASDALASMLTILAWRRVAFGVPSFARQHVMIDVLRTIPRAATWTPLMGTLRLSLQDLRGGHPAAREVLDTLNDRKMLVRRKGDTKGKKKILYEFDTCHLAVLFENLITVSS